jgi:prepilin-type N-terminal cleavage/methylation domain-containing protein/prepilin-type processing-associated H-X9-DG protein
MQRKRAFTLIELLVVIAIIAILAAILFPVFAKARERAEQSASLNNVKQLTLGVITYAQDYDQTFPGWVDNTGAGAYAHNTWDEQINSQIKSKDVFSNGQTGIKSPSDPQKQRVITYGLNGALIATMNGAGQTPFTATAAAPPAILSPGSVTNPADTILFAELATDFLITNTPPNAVGLRPATGTNGTVTDANGSDAWKAALPTSGVGSVIDISPRDWVTVAGSINGTAVGTDGWINDASTGWPAASQTGVARDLYGGGGTYGFVDGHVKFMKIGESVGWGKRVGNTTIDSTAKAWATSGANANTENKWFPSR